MQYKREILGINFTKKDQNFQQRQYKNRKIEENLKHSSSSQITVFSSYSMNQSPRGLVIISFYALSNKYYIISLLFTQPCIYLQKWLSRYFLSREKNEKISQRRNKRILLSLNMYKINSLKQVKQCMRSRNGVMMCSRQGLQTAQKII